MKLFELTTGVIAAVILTLGVGHYMNNTKVGEEPTVEKSSLTEAWFEYTGPLPDDPDPLKVYDPHNPANYTLYQGSGDPSCATGTIVCAIYTRVDDTDEENPIPNSDDLADLEENITNLDPIEDELMFKPLE